MSQIHKMAFTVARLQTTLDVYSGFFDDKENAEKMIKPFQEIGLSIRRALSTDIIIGCASLFTDKAGFGKDENLSLKNLEKKYGLHFSEETRLKVSKIDHLCKTMNLSDFRHKYIAHVDLEISIGNKKLNANITYDKLRELLDLGATLLNNIAHDAKLRPRNHWNDFRTLIPDSRSPSVFLEKISL